MFNAIFGNFLFSQQKVETVEDDQHAAAAAADTQHTTTLSEASTQTNKTTRPPTANLRRSYSAVVAANLPKSKVEHDWVIVDPSEEADKLNKSTLTHNECEESEMETGAEAAPAAPALHDEDGDIMLRSFFDRAEQEGVAAAEASRQGAFIRSVYGNAEPEPMQAKPADQWLITPLPCLTSIQSTQVENAPLENLLIEQPCVYMKASSKPATKKTAAKPAVAKQAIPAVATTKPVDPTPAPTPIPVVNKPLPHPNDVVMSSPIRLAPPCMRKMTQSYSSIVKSVAEKRKETSDAPSQVLVPKAALAVVAHRIALEDKKVDTAEKMEETVVSAPEVLVLALPVLAPVVESAPAPAAVPVVLLARESKKSSKKSKKNNGSAGSPLLSRAANKENSHVVKSLLMSDQKAKAGNGNGQSRADLAGLLANTKQMKRNNKSLILTSSSSLKQRKYHNLQQPMSFNSTQF